LSAPSTRIEVIHVGGLFVAPGPAPALIRTLLGSCIAACLHDPVARVGGMNHFMLPRPEGRPIDANRFGVHAMEELIFRMQNHGAHRHRLVGKLFGGGHVLRVDETEDSVPRRNIRFIEEFMVVEGIPVASRDLGGRDGRIILFSTETGQAFVRRVAGAPDLLRDEQRLRRSPPVQQPASDVTLFIDDPPPPTRRRR
jgi:chemotaxis receptor (MCP) glutamine deamidase CheD